MQAATLYWQLGGWANLDQAKDMLDKVLTVQPVYPQAQCLKAWIELALEEADEACVCQHRVACCGQLPHAALAALAPA